MQSRIIIRQTEDWDNPDTYAYLRNYHKKFAHMLEWPQFRQRYQQFVDNVVNWNREHLVSYMQYRGAVHRIARKNWQATGAEITLDTSFEPDPELILIPTDDDDWFHPQLVDRLHRVFAAKHIDIVVWRCHHLRPGGKVHIDSMSDRVSSNGYAIRASVATERLIQHHAAINELKFKRIADPGLSVWLRHSACWTKVSRRDFQFEDMSMPRLNRINWAKPYVEDMIRLNLPARYEPANP